MNIRNICVAATLLLGATAADAVVRYEFRADSSFGFDIGNGTETFTGSFVLEVPDFIVPSATIPAADLISCSYVGSISGSVPCGDQGFLVGIFSDYETLSFGTSVTGLGIFYYYTAGTFGTPGVHSSELFGSDQFGELRITDLDGPVIPEPATWAMMIAGFGLVGGSFRQRRTAIA